jgi:preprotein translocase subunit SecE
MVEQAEQQTTAPVDMAKYVLAIALVAGGIFAYYWLGWAAPLRALLVAAEIVAAGAVVAFTAKGRDAREFISESMFELRKVVWPTSQEALRITFVILVVVVIVMTAAGGH